MNQEKVLIEENNRLVRHCRIDALVVSGPDIPKEGSCYWPIYPRCWLVGRCCIWI